MKSKNGKQIFRHNKIRWIDLGYPVLFAEKLTFGFYPNPVLSNNNIYPTSLYWTSIFKLVECWETHRKNLLSAFAKLRRIAVSIFIELLSVGQFQCKVVPRLEGTHCENNIRAYSTIAFLWMNYWEWISKVNLFYSYKVGSMQLGLVWSHSQCIIQAVQKASCQSSAKVLKPIWWWKRSAELFEDWMFRFAFGSHKCNRFGWCFSYCENGDFSAYQEQASKLTCTAWIKSGHLNRTRLNFRKSK